MRLKVILAVFLIAMGCFASLETALALECQHTTNNPYTEKRTVFYEDNEVLNYNLLEANNFTTGSFNTFFGRWDVPPSFYVYNKYDRQLNVTVNWIYRGASSSMEYVIDSQGYAKVEYDSYHPADAVDPASVFYDIRDEEVSARRKVVRVDNYTCAECPSGSGILCLNDGDTCQTSRECGSSYCIRNKCSASPDCYNGNCECAPDEIQCSDDESCVARDVVPLDVKPHCDLWEECVTNYLDPNTGLCAYSPSHIQELEANRTTRMNEQKEKEQRDFINFILLGIIVGFIVLSLLGILARSWMKSADEKIKSEIKLIEVAINKDKGEAARLSMEIEEGKNNLQLLKAEIRETKGHAKKKIEDELKKQEEHQRERFLAIKIVEEEQNNKERELQRKFRELDEKERKREERAVTSQKNTQEEIKAAIAKYERIYGSEKIIYNRASGYMEFKKGNEPLHRYIYRHKIGSINSYDEIHHIDNDKLNNDLWNLMPLFKAKHNNLSHGKIEMGNWESGIEQLKKQLKMRDEDFPLHIQEELKRRRDRKN